ncbi:class I SAM-dependent methyltransferase [Streptomyces sp. NPDC004050]
MDRADAERKRGYWDRYYSGVDVRDTYPVTGLEMRRFREDVQARDAGTVLDVGCGLGVWPALLAEHADVTVIGYDWSPVAIHAATEFLSGPRVIFDVHDFLEPGPPPALTLGEVDVVSFRFVLQYLPPQKILAAAATWLRPGTGTVYVVTQVRDKAPPERSQVGFTTAEVEALRDGWQHSRRWDLHPSGEITALALRDWNGHQPNRLPVKHKV